MKQPFTPESLQKALVDYLRQPDDPQKQHIYPQKAFCVGQKAEMYLSAKMIRHEDVHPTAQLLLFFQMISMDSTIYCSDALQHVL